MKGTALLNALVARLGAELGQVAYDKILDIKNQTVKAQK